MKTPLLAVVLALTFPSFAARTPEMLLSAVPEPCTDEAYLRSNETGNRTEWGNPYRQRTEVIEELITNEARGGKGRFLPKIEEFLRAFPGMPTPTAFGVALKEISQARIACTFSLSK